MSRTRPPASPELIFFIGGVSQYIGAAIAIGLFDDLGPGGVALLRVLGAGVLIVSIRRSWRRHWAPSELAWVCTFGLALAGMNLSIYFAIDELPLGNAVAIEFLGPISVTALGARTRQHLTALLLAAAGVLILANIQSGASLRGVGFALLAGSFWAGYIVLGHRVARSGVPVDGVGIAMLAGAIAISPFGITRVTEALDDPWVLVLALTTGLFSNVIPYTIDQRVMRFVSRHRFALLQSMLPVTAALIGFVSLDQTPSLREVAGIGLVIGALVIQSKGESSRS